MTTNEDFGSKEVKEVEEVKEVKTSPSPFSKSQNLKISLTRSLVDLLTRLLVDCERQRACAPNPQCGSARRLPLPRNLPSRGVSRGRQGRYCGRCWFAKRVVRFRGRGMAHRALATDA